MIACFIGQFYLLEVDEAVPQEYSRIRRRSYSGQCSGARLIEEYPALVDTEDRVGVPYVDNKDRIVRL